MFHTLPCLGVLFPLGELLISAEPLSVNFKTNFMSSLVELISILTMYPCNKKIVILTNYWGSPGARSSGQSMSSPVQFKFGGQHNVPRNNDKSNSNQPNKQRTMLHGLAPAFQKFTYLINPASRDGRTIGKILDKEILFLNRLWSFCEDEFIEIVSLCISVKTKTLFDLKEQFKKLE